MERLADEKYQIPTAPFLQLSSSLLTSKILRSMKVNRLSKTGVIQLLPSTSFRPRWCVPGSDRVWATSGGKILATHTDPFTPAERLDKSAKTRVLEASVWGG